MSDFNSLPNEASPVLTDRVFTGRGTAAGAERKPTLTSLLALFQGSLNSVYQPLDSDLTAIAALTTTSYGRSVLELANAAAARTLFGAGTGNGDVIGPATSADDTIPIFNGTNNKTIEASQWKVTTSGFTLQSPILTNPSGDTLIQRWGGVMPSGGQVGGGLTDVILGMTRDIAGPSSAKLSDNWGLVYNRNNIAGAPRYGWGFETVFDVSMTTGGVSGEVYLEHRIDNGSGGAAAGSVVGGRLLQWNVGLPTSMAQDPTAAAAYDTANGKFPGCVDLIGVINSFSLQAYNSAGSARAAWAWSTASASAGITITSNTGYTFQRFTEWGGRTLNDENSIVGDATAAFNLRNTATGFTAGNGCQFSVGSSQHLEITNFENAYLKLRTNGGSFNPVMELSPGQRVFIGYNGSGITDSGATFQVKGNGLFTGTGDTELKIVGGSGPVLKFVSTQFSSGVDFQPDTTKFLLRINNNFPFEIQTNGTVRFNIHSTNSSYAPFNIGPSATVGTSMSRVKHGVATLVGGTVTVSETTVTSNSRILITSQVDGGTPGDLRISARTASTSFVITSGSGTDTSTVAWVMIEP